MSYNKKRSFEKKNFELRIKNKNINYTNNTRYDSYDTVMKKENIFESKLKFKPIFERIHKNKKQFNSILLSNLEKRKKKMEEIISVDILLNFIYRSGLPYKLDFKKHLKQVSIKEKANNNFDLEKIKLGALDYFNLESYRKGHIAQNKVNRMNEEHLLKSKNFNTNKSCIPQEITVYTAKNILKRFHLIKDNTKSKLFDYEKKYSPRKSVESQRHIIKSPMHNKNNCYKSKLFSTISKLHTKKNESSLTVRTNESKKDLDLPFELMNNTESKKIINTEDLNNFNLTDNEKSSTTNIIAIENPKRNISISDIVDNQESNIEIKLKNSKKNLKKLLLKMDGKEMDENYRKFKISFSDLNKYNKKRFHNYLQTIELNESDYDNIEEKESKEKEYYDKVSKNIQETKDKIKKVMHDYTYMMNRRSFTERNKKENSQIIKMFSSLGKKTIDNMATDLGTCQNHIKNKLIDFIDDHYTYRKGFKQLDPTLEILLDKKTKDYNKNEYNVKDDYDFIKDRELKEYQRKEIDRLGVLIGKTNDKVAYDLSHYLVLYNKNMGNKIEEIKNEKIKREKLRNIKHIKKQIESQIYNMKQIKQKNIFKFNKLMHKFDDFYMKIKNENKLKSEYKKLLDLNKKKAI